MKYPIGTMYKSYRGRLNTIRDYYITRNLAGDIVRERYVASHEFFGQLVFDYNVPDTEVARGLLPEYQQLLKGDIKGYYLKTRKYLI